MIKKIFFLLFIVSIQPFVWGQSEASPNRDLLIPDEVIVKLKKGITGNEFVRNQIAIPDLQVKRLLSGPVNIWLFTFDDQRTDINKVKDELNRLPEVLIVQENTYLKLRLSPNDPQYNNQWQHQNIDSEKAWDITTGGQTIMGDDIVVCIVESAGMNHVDLSPNHWKNLAEIPNNGIDDDGNGYIDDYEGWNVDTNNDYIGNSNHGTAVAGMIGAAGNNGTGVAGANWDVKMMIVTGFDSLSQASVIEAYTYPLTMRTKWNETNGQEGAFVVATNSSWGLDLSDPNDYPVWCDFYNTMGEAGILSFAATANSHWDIDVVGDMPTGCSSEYMVAVTATNQDDIIDFSAYGIETIDVGAPGSGIYTTSNNNSYDYTSGTSFASPLTAGVTALLYSVACDNFMEFVKANPAEGALLVRDALFNGVDQNDYLLTRVKTGGRINSKNSLYILMDEFCQLLNNDLGVIAINSPEPGQLGENETINITVKNFGVNDQGAYPVYYYINEGEPVYQNSPSFLPSQNETSFAFTATADLSELGFYSITAGTALPGDEFAANNEFTIIVENTILDIQETETDDRFVILDKKNNLFDIQLKNQKLKGDNISFRIYDSSGRVVSHDVLKYDNGKYTAQINMANKPTGVYYVGLSAFVKDKSRSFIVK